MKITDNNGSCKVIMLMLMLVTGPHLNGQIVIDASSAPIGYCLGSTKDRTLLKGKVVHVEYTFTASGKLLDFSIIIPGEKYETIWTAIVVGDEIVAQRKQWVVLGGGGSSFDTRGMGALADVEILKIDIKSENYKIDSERFLKKMYKHILTTYKKK